MSHNPFSDSPLNPYDAPKQTSYDSYSQPPSYGRPTSVTVFGVLNIVFGIIGSLMVIGTIFMLASDVPNPLMDHPVYGNYAKIELGFGIVFTIIMISAGIGLLQLKSYGRTLSIVWSIYKIIFVIISAIMTFTYVVPLLFQDMRLGPDQRGAAAVGAGIGGVIAAIVWMIYPIVMLTFMLSPKLKSAFQQAQQPDPFQQMQQRGQF